MTLSADLRMKGMSMRRMLRRIGGIFAAVSLVVATVGVIGGATANAVASGPDLTASISLRGASTPGQQNIGGFAIANVGNAAATGTTTITVSVPPSVVLQGVMYYTCSTSPPGTCTLTESVSADGHTVVLTYVGTIAAGTVLSNFQVVGAITNPPLTSGDVTIMVSNTGDINPANNTTDDWPHGYQPVLQQHHVYGGDTRWSFNRRGRHHHPERHGIGRHLHLHQLDVATAARRHGDLTGQGPRGGGHHRHHQRHEPHGRQP
jgi:hypothetical protein